MSKVALLGKNRLFLKSTDKIGYPILICINLNFLSFGIVLYLFRMQIQQFWSQRITYGAEKAEWSLKYKTHKICSKARWWFSIGLGLNVSIWVGKFCFYWWIIEYLFFFPFWKTIFIPVQYKWAFEETKFFSNQIMIWKLQIYMSRFGCYIMQTICKLYPKDQH